MKIYTKHLNRCYNRAYKMGLLSFNIVSYFIHYCKMKSSLITLGILLSIIYCKGAILDYSNIAPWKVAYAVYPVYEPESWVDVRKNERSPDSWVQLWKNERSWDVHDIHDTILNVRSNDDHKNGNDVNRRIADVSDSHTISQAKKSTDDENLKPEQVWQATPTHSWQKNYKYWPKNGNKERPSV